MANRTQLQHNLKPNWRNALGIIFSAALIFNIASATPAAAQSCNPISIFAEETTYDVGDSPQAFVATDFTQDGMSDLLVTNLYSQDLSLLTGSGDGTFQPERRLPFGDPTYSAVSADFNQDGHMDVVASDPIWRTVFLFFGRGDGRFQAPETLWASAIRYIVIEDLNGDGHLDIAGTEDRGPAQDPQGSILFGNGDGTFEPEIRFETGMSAPGPLAAADLDNDGNTDLVLADVFDAKLGVLMGQGDGSFAARAFTVEYNPQSVMTADFNNDGLMDMATPATGGGGFVYVHLGRGDGTFERSEFYAAGERPFRVVAAYLNNDDALDIAAVDRELGNISVLYGRGDGTFERAIQYGQAFGESMDILAGDFDNNGFTDLATINRAENTVSLFVNQCEECLVDLDGNGQLNVYDFLEFQNLWLRQDPRVDFDGDGAFTFVDFQEFSRLFALGCE